MFHEVDSPKVCFKIKKLHKKTSLQNELSNRKDNVKRNPSGVKEEAVLCIFVLALPAAKYISGERVTQFIKEMLIYLKKKFNVDSVAKHIICVTSKVLRLRMAFITQFVKHNLYSTIGRCKNVGSDVQLQW